MELPEAVAVELYSIRSRERFCQSSILVHEGGAITRECGAPKDS